MVSVKDIARLSGFSQATVSMVMSGRGAEYKISDATIRHIQAIAKREGYHPNQLARAVRTGRTGIVAILLRKEILEQIATGTGYHETTMELQARLLLSGYKVMLESLTAEDCSEGKLPSVVASGFSQMSIICGALPLSWTESKRYIKKFQQSFPNLLSVDKFYEGIPCIAHDNIRAGREVADYLWERGHRTFGVLLSAKPDFDLGQRAEGFMQRIVELAGNDRGITQMRVHDLWSKECGARAIAAFLKNGGRFPDALFAVNGFIADSVESELLRRGISIPNDVSLIAIGQQQLAAQAPVPFTVYDWKGESYMKLVMEQLKSFAAGRELEARCYTPECFFTESGSVADKRKRSV